MKKYIIIIYLLISASILAQNGIVKTYHSNREVKSRESYVNDILDGISYWYYENGNLQFEKSYSAGVLNGWVREYYEAGLIKEEYFVKDGIKDGILRKYFENGGLKEVISFEDGIFLKKTEINFDSNYVAVKNNFVGRNGNKNIAADDFICDVDICPEPLNGLGEIQNKLVYPTDALAYGLEGEVILIATINKQGKVSKTSIVEGLGLGCSEAAIRAVRETKFIPGQKDGAIAEANVTIKLKFIIDKKIDEVHISNNIKPTEIAKTPEYDEKAELKDGMNLLVSKIDIPSMAKRVSLNGEIVVEVVVDEYGFVRDTKIIKGLGFGADQAVESAIMQSEFIPAKLNDKFVQSKINLVVPFKAEN